MTTEKPAHDLVRQLADAVDGGDKAKAEQIRGQLPRGLRRRITIRRISQQRPEASR